MLVLKRGVARVTDPYAAPKRAWYLSRIDLFEGVADSDVEAWVQRCGVRTFEAGQRIIDAHATPPEQVHVICEGVVRVLVERRPGRAATVDLLGRGQLFGVSTAFGASSTGLHADALTRAVVCVADGQRFLGALASCPDLLQNLVRQVGVRVVCFGADNPQPAQPSAEVRLAEVLRRLARTGGASVQGGARIPACVSRGTLAHQVGCTRETVARLLSHLETSGSVVRQGRAIVVNLDRLDAVLTFQAPAASRG